MKTIVYVKKLWSLNPDKYIKISLKKALSKYHEYILNTRYEGTIKTFEEWLKTEI